MIRTDRFARADLFLLLAWVLEFLRLVWPSPLPPAIGAALMAAFLVSALPRLNRRTLVLCSVLAVLTTILAVMSDGWGQVVLALDRATGFAAFFCTILVLRATADRRPETGTARTIFQRVSPAQQSGAFLIGANMIGAVLVAGTMAILAPIMSADASDKERRAAAESCLRGVCLAPLWSPFWIAMAVTYQYLPDVPLWQILVAGIPLSVIGLVMAHLMYARGVGLVQLWQAVKGLAPIAPPVALCALAIVLATSLFHLTTLQSVIVCTPVVCALGLIAVSRNALVSAVGAVYRGIGSVSDEVSIVTMSLVLGRVMEKTLGEAGVTDAIRALQLPPESYIAIIVAFVSIGALIGIHQIVAITIVLVLLVPLATEVADVLLMEAALLGWAFASMVGITAVAVASASSMFKVRMELLSYGPNLWFVAVFGTLATALLMAANRFI